MSEVLHPAQYDIYTDQVLNLDSPHYNIGLYIKLKRNLDKEKFYEAVKFSYTAFDIFKMRFDFENTEGSFYLNKNYEVFDLDELDFSNQPNPKTAAQTWMQNRFNTSFVLQKKHVFFEQALIKIAEDEHWFFFRFHHLLIDAYGLAIWVNCIAKKYKALLAAKDLELVQLSYIAETAKAAAYRNSAEYAQSGKYWKNKIGTKPEGFLKKNINFKSKPEKQSGNYYYQLRTDQQKQLEEVVQKTKCNLQQLTIAALLVYFGKTSAQTEMVFGIPVHKRSTKQLRQIAGMFSGVLPFKGFFQKGLKLSDLLNWIVSSQKEDRPHQQYLVGDLIRSLNINTAESNLYDVVVNYIPFQFELDFGEDIEPSVGWLQSEQEKLPLQVSWRDYGKQQSLELALHFGYEYFSLEEATLLAQRILFILGQFAGSLDQTIENIGLIPPQEKLLLDKFNDTFAPFSTQKTVVDLFEEQVLKSPDTTAVLFEEEVLTYFELNLRANQLAHYLEKKGVKAETLVPVCMERSVEMIVAIFGILKAGGAYVPINPEYPEERIQFILDDTAANIIVTSKQIRPHLKNIGKRSIVAIDADWEVIGQGLKINFQSKIKPHNLAYVIYTSGSTGKPKGVLAEHKGLVNFCKAVASELEPQPGERVLQFASISFDVSCEEIFNTLLSAGTVVVPKKGDILSAEKFQAFISKYKIERATLPPSYQSVMKDALGTLKTVISAGESINPSIAKFIQSKGVWLINGYGPTENTISVCIAKNPVNKLNRNIIGKPLANVQVYILDSKQQLLPIGCTGEICVGGVQVARGYLNRPEITAEKFITDPFSQDINARVYRTGDLGRWLPDGNLEFFGRADNQVKIRGFRIELEEIEHVMQQSGLVRQAVVLAQPDREGNQQLVCYLVKHNGFDQEKLIVFLSDQLPGHMVPTFWVELNQFPLTTSGKIDKKALPKAEGSGIKNKVTIAPRTKQEADLIILWKKLLHLDEIGINHNFFSLGGNSLLAIKLIAQVKKGTGKSLPIKSFLENPTVKSLAKLLVESNPDGKTDLLIPLKTQGWKTPFYIVCGAGGTALPFYEFAKMFDAEQPVFVLQQPVNFDHWEGFPDTVEGISAIYIEAILVQNPEGPYALSGHCVGGIIAFEMAKQLRAMGKEVKMLALFDTVITEEKREEPTFTNFDAISNTIKNYVDKAYSKIGFEAFLLRKHTKHAIQYKLKSLQAFVQKFYNHQLNETDLHGFKSIAQKYQTTCSNYCITKYEGDMLVFFAKDRYTFVDKNNNILYNKILLDNATKHSWERYASNVKGFEIEGEHSTIFDPIYAKELVKVLQQNLDHVSDLSLV